MKIDKKYSTQEESVIASWLKAEHKKGNDPREKFGNSLYKPKRWGLMIFSEKLGRPGAKHTIQKEDYTTPFWDDKIGLPKSNQIRKYNFCYLVEGVPLNDSGDTVRRDVDLFFIFGPNVNAYNTPFGSIG